jgi:hypothetical protein
MNWYWNGLPFRQSSKISSCSEPALQVLAVGVGRMVGLWPSQDARKTRPMKCPEAGR